MSWPYIFIGSDQSSLTLHKFYDEYTKALPKYWDQLLMAYVCKFLQNNFSILLTQLHCICLITVIRIITPFPNSSLDKALIASKFYIKCYNLCCRINVWILLRKLSNEMTNFFIIDVLSSALSIKALRQKCIIVSNYLAL